MSWIIVRNGPLRYLKSTDVHDAYSFNQLNAIRFATRGEALRAKRKWTACWSSSWPCRVVKLLPRGYWKAKYVRLREAASDIIAYEWSTVSAVPPNQVAWCKLRDAIT